MKAILFVVLIVAVAAPALAHEPASPSGSSAFGYQAGFGYQAAPQHSRPRHDHGYRRPEREITTITPLENGGQRIETRREYEPRRAGKFVAPPQNWR
ncbi:MAG: hypothetical protein ACREQJ_15245 [Candidatus Binatia bacterium]